MSKKKITLEDTLIYAIFILLSLFILYPIWCILSVSVTNAAEITQFGFTLWPKHLDLASYEYLLKDSGTILKAYGTTISVAVVGTVIGCFTSTLYAYVLSKRNFPLVKLFSFLLLFTMFFNGGMAASYIVNVSILNLKNSFWILVLPSAFGSVNVIIARAYFMQLPNSMIESAKIDGADEYTIFGQLVFPLSKPAVATVCLTLFINYWNAYYEAMMYMDTGRYVTIQLLLQRLMANVDFLKQYSSSDFAQMQLAQLPGDSLRMAVCAVIVIPVLLVFPRFQKYFVKGMAIGSVKE
ncbi:MAG: carbohydrate ABC transporter permease [Lachnospiraceae bacterium]|nr:carbohydrate ABC transporter permease [Lachnospiraceae bacterium]